MTSPLQSQRVERAVKDRRRYRIVCEHLAERPRIRAASNGFFRLCCTACADSGFLAAPLEYETSRPDGLTVGRRA